MKVNENKRKEMVITFRKASSPLPPVNMNGRELEVVHHFKLLGVWQSDNLSWHHNTSKICAKVVPRLYYL